MRENATATRVNMTPPEPAAPLLLKIRGLAHASPGNLLRAAAIGK
jgi:hypothetical protein